MPVSDGVNTSCPASRSGLRTKRKPHEPPHAPCTRTNVVMDRTLARLAAARNERPPKNPAVIVCPLR